MLIILGYILIYFSIGLFLGRRTFVWWMGDQKRTVRPCEAHNTWSGCHHKKDKDGEHINSEYTSAKIAGWLTFLFWPITVIGTLVVLVFLHGTGNLSSYMFGPTPSEKLTQREKDLQELIKRAKELNIPIPEDWTSKELALGIPDEMLENIRRIDA